MVGPMNEMVGRKRYGFMFRCRMCDEVYESAATANRDIVEDVMFEIVHRGASSVVHGVPVTLMELHHHNDGSVGVADFIGAQLFIYPPRPVGDR